MMPVRKSSLILWTANLEVLTLKAALWIPLYYSRPMNTPFILEKFNSFKIVRSLAESTVAYLYATFLCQAMPTNSHNCHIVFESNSVMNRLQNKSQNQKRLTTFLLLFFSFINQGTNKVLWLWIYCSFFIVFVHENKQTLDAHI